MLDNRVIDLVNREIDGETTPDETRSLSALRNRDREVDTFFLETRAVCDALDDLALEEPPEGLADLVAAETRQLRDAGPVVLPFPSPAARRRRVVVWASMGAAAALLAAVLLSPGLVRRSDESQMSGTMTSPPSAVAEVIDVPVDTGAVAGAIRVALTGEDVRLVVAVSPRPAPEGGLGDLAQTGRLEIAFDPVALRVASAPPGTAVDSGTGRVDFEMPPWRDLEVRFVRISPAGSTLTVSVETRAGRETVPIPLPASDK